MIYSILNCDFFCGNFLLQEAVVLSKVSFMVKKVLVLGTHADILINNVLSETNDHLESSGSRTLK